MTLSNKHVTSNPTTLEAIEHLNAIGATVKSSAGKVTEINFDECPLDTVQHDSLARLAHFSSMADVCFYGTPVDGPILSSLTCQATLRSLNLNCSTVGNSDIVPVQHFSSLEFLGLMDTSVNDDAIDLILHCSKLNYVRIDGAAISDVGAASLARSLPLTRFWISGSQISAASIDAIRCLKNVREIELFGSDVNDSCLQFLEPLAGANYVGISRYARLTRNGSNRLGDLFPHLK